MPVFVDPRTGERFENVPEDQQERARSLYGLLPEREWQREQRPIGEKLEEGIKAFGTAAGRGAEVVARPLRALVGDEADPEQQAEFEAKAYGPEAQQLRADNPITSAVGEQWPSIGAGAAIGGAAVGLKSGAALLGAESSLSGISQEAIDATMEKRDFSAKSALWNGVLDLTFGALGAGAAAGLGRLGKPASAAVDASTEIAPGVPGKRNFLAEVDRGAVPEPRGKRPARSVGAASGATGDTMSRTEVASYIRDEDDIIDNLQTIAGGGPGERGAFQAFNDSFRESMSNRVKRADFDAAEAAAAPEVRQAMNAEANVIASELEGVAETLESRGAKRQADLLRRHIAEIESTDTVASTLDRTKQTLDALHLKAISDVNDPYGDVLSAVDPAVNRIRKVLENPEYVGKQIAEHQQVRNAAWSDKDTGFIRNMKIANAAGPKLFKSIEVDYHTGELVMQFDPSGFKSLLSMDQHQAKPVLEAWEKILKSAEDMTLNTVEVGAKSAADSPLVALQQSINDIRRIFTQRARLYAAKDIGKRGLEALNRVEAIPFLGKGVGLAKSIGGAKNVEAAAGAAGYGYLPTKDRSVAAAKAALERYDRRPSPALQGAMDTVAWRQGQEGAVSLEGGILTSPMGLTAGVGVAALGATAALRPEQEQAREAFGAQLQALPPDTQARQIAAAETLARVASQTEARVRSAIGALFRPSRERHVTARVRAAEKRATELDLPRAVARFMGPREDDPVVAWKQKRDLLQDVVNDPSKLIEAMTANMGDLPQLQPELFGKMVAQAMATVDYLHQSAPAPAGKSVFDPEGYPPGLEEIAAWAGRWVGALHPLDTLDDLAANDLQPEQLDAVKALHPDAFQLFQQTALSEIGRIRQSRKRIPMRQLELLDSALELDGAGEPTLSWEMARLIQVGEQQAAQTGQQPPQASPMQSKGAERMASSSLASIRPEAGAL